MKAVVGKTVVAEAAREAVVRIESAARVGRDFSGYVAFDAPGPYRELTEHADR